MKKLFLFVAAVALTVSLNSCSKSSSGSSNKVSLKIGSVSKTFNVETTSYQGMTSVFGYIGNIDTPTEEITFSIASGETGANKVVSLVYTSGSTNYFASTVTSNVTKHTSSSVEGTFSATATPIAGGDSVSITEGTFSSGITAVSAKN